MALDLAICFQFSDPTVPEPPRFPFHPLVWKCLPSYLPECRKLKKLDTTESRAAAAFEKCARFQVPLKGLRVRRGFVEFGHWNPGIIPTYATEFFKNICLSQCRIPKTKIFSFKYQLHHHPTSRNLSAGHVGQSELPWRAVRFFIPRAGAGAAMQAVDYFLTRRITGLLGNPPKKSQKLESAVIKMSWIYASGNIGNPVSLKGILRKPTILSVWHAALFPHHWPIGRPFDQRYCVPVCRAKTQWFQVACRVWTMICWKTKWPKDTFSKILSKKIHSKTKLLETDSDDLMHHGTPLGFNEWWLKQPVLDQNLSTSHLSEKNTEFPEVACLTSLCVFGSS